MAVQDKYVNSDLAAGRFASPYNQSGFVEGVINQAVDVAVADDDGSIYRLGRIRSSDVPARSQIACQAITNGTDYDLGVYKAGVGGAVVSKDVFMNGQTMASASITINGLSALTGANFGKQLWEILGLTSDPQIEYDLVLTANTVGSAAGRINVIYEPLTI